MLRRLVRYVVTTALGLALWMAASTARAASPGTSGAPMCDFQAASVNAPAPTLDTPQSATEISVAPSAAAFCDAPLGSERLDPRFPGRLHRAAPREAARAEDSACDLPSSSFLPPRLSARLRGFVRTSGARDGTRSPLERPPRLV